MPVAEGYASFVGSYRRLQCCDPTVEERRYGKSVRHVLETGGGTTASGDPVLVARVPQRTHPWHCAVYDENQSSLIGLNPSARQLLES